MRMSITEMVPWGGRWFASSWGDLSRESPNASTRRTTKVVQKQVAYRLPGFSPIGASEPPWTSIGHDGILG